MLAAPGRVSMTIVVPRASPSRWPRMRAVISEPPPGAHGTIMRIGFVG
jgi:hypothetical protein